MNEEMMTNLIKLEKSCWIGLNPPAGMKSYDISNSTNYRLSSNSHHKYNAVWMIEECLESYGVL